MKKFFIVLTIFLLPLLLFAQKKEKLQVIDHVLYRLDTLMTDVPDLEKVSDSTNLTVLYYTARQFQDTEIAYEPKQFPLSVLFNEKWMLLKQYSKADTARFPSVAKQVIPIIIDEFAFNYVPIAFIALLGIIAYMGFLFYVPFKKNSMRYICIWLLIWTGLVILMFGLFSYSNNGGKPKVPTNYWYEASTMFVISFLLSWYALSKKMKNYLKKMNRLH